MKRKTSLTMRGRFEKPICSSCNKPMKHYSTGSGIRCYACEICNGQRFISERELREQRDRKQKRSAKNERMD